jgi:chorismate mutase/prephenate dehydratase
MNSSSPTPPPDQRLQPLREQIDQLDQQIVRLLNERAAVAIEVGRIKHTDGSPVYVPHRERAVMDKVRRLNEGPLPASALEAIYREIISASIALERPLRVGFLGPEGSFSHLAARAHFGTSVDYAPVDEIVSVFQEVERGNLDVGLVPIENSTGGGIRDTLDCFMQSTVKVCAEVAIQIHHNLMSRAAIEDVKRIVSRPEVFEQCRRWLGNHARHAEREAVSSSAKAAEMAAADAEVAAIGSQLAAEIYNLPIRAANIEDNPQNVTRFFVVGRMNTEPTGADKTAIMFTTAHKPGALAEVINVFAENGVNLTHIDKRPSQRVNWEYIFFIDAEGHEEEPAIRHALEEARRHCLHLSVLGSFPKATQVYGAV